MAVASSSCAGYASLSETDLNARQALGYVDRTPIEAQNCANCRFKAAYAEDANCIGCTLFAGPVSPWRLLHRLGRRRIARFPASSSSRR